MQMLLIGTSYKTSPVNIREKISISKNDLDNTLHRLSFYNAINEVVILSTCNRTEFYIATFDLDQATKSLIQFLEDEKNINFKDFANYFYIYYNKFAAEHLYKVTCGIESLVLGETEILSQVKDAFFIAKEIGVTNKIFNSLFKFAIETGKKVRTETNISKGLTSAGSVAVELIFENFKDINSKTVLLIGTGQIGEITAKNLKSKGICNLIITNRSFDKAEKLSKELNADVINFENFEKYLNFVDIIITCTGASDYLITEKNYKPNKQVLLIDLSIPRNISPKLAKNKNIKLYDIDSLEDIVNKNLKERQKILIEVESIIKEDMVKFVDWYNNLEISPVICSISSLFHEIKNNEISKVIKKNNLDKETEELLNIVTTDIIKKIIHYPVTNMKMEEDKNLKKQYAENLSYLFQLDSEDIFQKYFRKKEKKTILNNSELNK